METKTKKQTVSYIFLLTVVPQVVFWAVTASIGCWSIWMNSSVLISLLAIVGSIAWLLSFVAISVFVKGYGLSIFARRRKEPNFNYEPSTVKEYDVHLGRKNTFTGRRSVIVRERKVKSGGVILMYGGQALLVGLTGIFKFIIETLRVLHSDERQAQWEECREFLHEKMGESDSKISFFAFPLLCGVVLLAVWVLIAPIKVIEVARYHPKYLEFHVDEKINAEYSKYRILSGFVGEIENTGRTEIEQIKGKLIFKDRDGNILFEKNYDITDPPGDDDEFLSKGERWEIELSVIADPSNEDAQRFWEMDSEDIEIVFEISEIQYKKKDISFLRPRTVVIKPIGE